MRFTGLWQEPDFLRLWTAHTISRFGSEVSQLAIPLTAALVLNATPFQMGLLGAFEFAPFLALCLLAGVWVDRLPRRPILVLADVGRFAILSSIPLAAVLDRLSIEQLYAVALVNGTLTVFFDVADQSYLPALVSRDHVVEGNSKLEMSRSIAQIVGPGAAGMLVQVITAPLAVVVDAVSFLASGMCVLLIRRPEQRGPGSATGPSGLWTELREGLALVVRNLVLRSIAGCTGTWNLFSNGSLAISVLYLTRDLELPPALIGLVLAAAGPGAFVGAVAAGRVARRAGLGRTIVGAALLGTACTLLVPLAGGPVTVLVGCLMLAGFVGGLAGTLYNVNQVSLRQAITPDRLTGRMNASMRFLVWGTIPLGALLGGALGNSLGLRPTLLLLGCGTLLAPLWLVWSPVRKLKAQPAPGHGITTIDGVFHVGMGAKS
jgi:predicted MFS family arabinose efflux permease